MVPLHGLLQAARQPFRLSASSDLERFSAQISEFLMYVAECALLPVQSLQLAALDVLHGRADAALADSSRLAACARAHIEGAHVARQLVAVLEYSAPQPSLGAVSESALVLLSKLCALGADACDVLATAGGLAVLVHALPLWLGADDSATAVERDASLHATSAAAATSGLVLAGAVCDVLIDVLETSAAAHAILASVELLLPLRRAFVSLLPSRHPGCRAVRNDIALVLSLLLHRGLASPDGLAHSGIVHVALVLCTAPELGAIATALTRHAVAIEAPPCDGVDVSALDWCEADHTLKLLLWGLLLAASGSAVARDAIAAAELLATLLLYVDPSRETATLGRWSVAQYHVLQMHALSLIGVLARDAPGDFAARRGPALLLEMLVAAQDDAELRARTLAALLAIGDRVASELVALGAVATLTALVRDASAALVLRRDACLLLSLLADDNTAGADSLGRAGGVAVLVATVAEQAAAMRAHSEIARERVELALAATDALWRGAVPQPHNLTALVASGGVFVLLDAATAHAAMHGHALGALCDALAARPALAQALRAWRQPEAPRRGLWHFLCGLWRMDASRLGVAGDGGGVVVRALAAPLAPDGSAAMPRLDTAAVAGDGDADGAPPGSARSVASYASAQAALASDLRERLSAPVQPAGDASLEAFAATRAAVAAVAGAPAGALATAPADADAPAATGTDPVVPSFALDAAAVLADLDQSAVIADVACNTRAKVYVLLSRLGVAVPDDCEPLSARELALWDVIQHYPLFKAGEVFLELGAELAAAGVRPTSPDAERMQAMQQRVVAVATAVRERQLERLACERDGDLNASDGELVRRVQLARHARSLQRSAP